MNISPLIFDQKLLDPEPYSDKREPLANRVYRVLTRSTLRNGPVPDEMQQLIKDHIQDAIESNKPIRIIYGTGGGRGYNTYDHPHVSWPEFFHLQFLYENLYPITQIYEPGILIDWSPDDFASMIINNYKKEWIDIYHAEFPLLIEYFQQHTVGNFLQTYQPSSNWYDYDDLVSRVQARADRYAADPAFVEKTYAQWLKRAMNNLYLEGDVSEEEHIRQAKRSTLVNLAWLDEDYEDPGRAEFWSNGIPVAHFRDFEGTYCIRALKNSTVQQWKGNGYILMDGEKARPQIVSRTDWAKIEAQLQFIEIENPTKLNTLDTIPVFSHE